MRNSRADKFKDAMKMVLFLVVGCAFCHGLAWVLAWLLYEGGTWGVIGFSLLFWGGAHWLALARRLLAGVGV